MSIVNLGLQQQTLDAVQANGSDLLLSSVIDRGTNLCNQKSTKNTLIKNDGSVFEFSNYETTDFIPVSSSVYPILKVAMYRSTTIVTDVYARIAFYTRDYQYIQDSYKENVEPSLDIAIPITAAFCRICCASHNTYPNLFIVNYADRFIGIMGYQYHAPRLASQHENKSNLIDRNNLNTGVLIKNATGEFGRDLVNGMSCTPFIPVKYGHRYFCNAPLYNDLNDRIWEYNEKHEPISYAERKPFYTPTSSDVKYVAFIYKGEIPKDTFIGMIDAEDWDGNIGELIANNGKYEERRVSKGFPIDGLFFVGAYGEHKVLQKFSSGDLYYINGTLQSGEVTRFPFNSSTFPNLKSGSTLRGVYFFDTNEGVRCLIFMSKNQIYCSTESAFNGFEIPNIWDLKGNKYWNADEADKDTTNTRYRMHFPTDVEDRQNAFSWHNGPIWMNGIGGQYSRGLMFANYTDAYNSSKALPSCVFYTEDGKNIYVQYMFGVYQKYYKTSDELSKEKESVSYNMGDDVDLTSFGTYLGGLSLRKRWNILPSESEADPTNIFEYADAVTITSISGKNFTLSSASGLRVGDVVVIQGTTGTSYDKIANNVASETNGGLTAFVIKTISGNVVTLADSIGNVANNLMCRHIHGIQEFGQGVVFYTGEEYPESYIMYMNPFQSSANDGTNMNNARWFDEVVRLNAGKNAYQRALGVYLRSDGKVVFIADSNSPNIAKLEVRGKSIMMGNYGIHIFDLADIDNATTLTKIQGLNAGYALYFLNGVLFFSDYKGKTYYSEDEGDSWKFLCVDGLTKSLHLGFCDYQQTHFFEVSKEQVVLKKI